jgi:hypothetical protein
MIEIPRISLVDTFNVIQLARETALAKGAQDQAKRLTPVVEGMHSLVTQSPATSTTPGANSGVMGQDDFRQLLNVAQSKSTTLSGNNTQRVVERNQMIQSMAAANMSELDIARQLGISREEVGLVLSMNERG